MIALVSALWAILNNAKSDCVQHGLKEDIYEFRSSLQSYHTTENLTVTKSSPLPPRRCDTCWKDEVKVRAEGRHLKACTKCNAIGRRVHYCSRWAPISALKLSYPEPWISDCQLKSWTDGFPVPHKQLCGKKFVDDSEPVPTIPKMITNIEDRIPPAAASFKRPPALLYQLSLLNEPPHFDYVVSNKFRKNLT